MMSQLFVLVALLLAPQEAGGEFHLRPTDVRTAAMIQLGLERSATFRQVAGEIAAGDVIVHVESDYYLPGRQTGRMRLIGHAGSRRYVRVSIRGDLPPHRYVASLAHELQHVSEVIAHPEVRDTASLEHLYRRIGREYLRAGRRAFETDAAKQVAIAVRREFINQKSPSTKNVNVRAR